MKPLHLCLCSLFLLALLSGCDDNSTGPSDAFDADRSTPENLVSDWLEKAYAGKDGNHYAEVLHPDYKFHFLAADAESLETHGFIVPGTNYWTREIEDATARNLFGSSDVGEITLNVTVDDTAAADSVCDGCVLVEALVDLQIVTNPTDPDPLILVVNSPQQFIVAPDPADGSKWVLFDQIDKPQPGGVVNSGMLIPSATEQSSWGSIKGLFAAAPALDASRSTPELLLTNWFEKVYKQQDLTHYAEMLHPDFRFEFLAEDAEALQDEGILEPGETSWPLSADLCSTGNMFTSTDVGGIALNITVNDTAAYGGCIDCLFVQAILDLQVVLNPTDPDPLILAINSPQDFIVSRDPADETKWVIFRQFDSPRPGAKEAATVDGSNPPSPATEGTSWGKIKGLFACNP